MRRTLKEWEIRRALVKKIIVEELLRRLGDSFCAELGETPEEVKQVLGELVEEGELAPEFRFYYGPGTRQSAGTLLF